MNAYRIVWEDEAKAREIVLMVDYALVAGVVSIESIRPTQITFYNPTTKSPARTLPVHTAAGRRLLEKQYLASRDLSPTLAEEIQQQLDLRDNAVSATVA